MQSNKPRLPHLKDLTTDNITDNVNTVNALNHDNARFRYVLERLVTHLHDFSRETRLSTKEWMVGLQFLTTAGQVGINGPSEFHLLSSILGLSLLVDAMDHPKPATATEGTLLGPFHTDDAEHLQNGALISQDTAGEPLLVVCAIKDTSGKPISGVDVDIWETDSTGHYDVQYANRSGPDGRCVMTSDAEGKFWFKGIVPVSYPIPHDGPVGQLLKSLGRHPWRPAHMHFTFEKAGWDKLVTALFMRGDQYETSDVVFGVKDSLIVNLEEITDKSVDPETGDSLSSRYGVSSGTKLLRYDFVLVSEEQSLSLRNDQSREALERLGRKVRVVDGLPVPDVDSSRE
ncbi:hypothetical protein H2198_009919 [Neophaeococcomyces mojaviensis]|uniref:Uncharacterized protein n=1 Tax=Neophaeococcomyces mojaviensis TaxID=3383035 RepID=A0ACC2ZTG4_9EURO|nr:hypothetical protein H2198_009919 [Knufia sp. JES_112]